MRLLQDSYAQTLSVHLLSVAEDGSFAAYEIKAAQTYRPEFLEGLHYLQNLFPTTLTSTRVIYDGEQTNSSQKDGFVNYRRW